MLTQKSKERCGVCNHRLTKNGHCLSCARKGNKNRARGKTYPAPPAPKTGAEVLCKETPKSVTQAPPNVKPGHGFKEMPGVGEYCPEPATNTIHASRPPEDAKLVIPIQEIDVCRRAINQYGILRQMAKAAEEFAEAAAAINRHIATEGSHEEIISELADVEVMCLQMRLIYGADAIDQARAEKVARLHRRLNP